ncbi:MAG: hypothetical protein EOO26_06250 [Comamonadaceae bacterium]|nr:MAG: hypothetical protein EOO26_06250 [Comamonadaceae bacterium]
MLHTTNLVRVCRDSGMSGSDIQGLVSALEARRRSSGRRGKGARAQTKAGAVTSIVGFARTLLATLR